jgi:putative addiction module CopG family antidote
MGNTQEAAMSLTLPPDLERFVRDQIAAGRFPTFDGVVEAGLRLLRDREDELRSLIATGIEQADRGETAPFDPYAALAGVKAALAARVRADGSRDIKAELFKNA